MYFFVIRLEYLLVLVILVVWVLKFVFGVGW